MRSQTDFFSMPGACSPNNYTPTSNTTDFEPSCLVEIRQPSTPPDPRCNQDSAKVDGVNIELFENLEQSSNALPDWRTECVDGSAIAPDLYHAATGIIEDTGYWEPNEALGQEVKVFWQTKPPHSYGALLGFYQEDGELWQAKPQNPRQFPKKGADGSIKEWKIAKYEAPKGAGSTPYLPTIPESIRRRVAQRYGCEVPREGSFWEWVAQNPSIPIVPTEGGKKDLSMLSAGYVAIGLYGVSGGYRSKDLLGNPTTPHLIPELERFCQPGRRVILAFDQDEDADTKRKVGASLAKFGQLLADAGCTVTVAEWDGSKGKGVDDLIASHGVEAFESAVTSARALGRYQKEHQKEKRQHQKNKARDLWLQKVSDIAGAHSEANRAQVATAFDRQHKLSGIPETGHFEPLELPAEGTRKMTVLDGSKMTRKTSIALKSAVMQGEYIGLSGILYAPTRVLARNLAKELGIYTTEQFFTMSEENRPVRPWLVACPESAWKLEGMTFDVVAFDEGNESIPRIQSGILGNHPEKSREVIKAQLQQASFVVVAQDGLYRPTVRAIQRWGCFDHSQVDAIHRKRPATQMKVWLYCDDTQPDEAWDGTESEQPPPRNDAFLSWADGIVKAVLAGRKVVIPTGSEGKGRAIHRLLRTLFPEKRGQVIDGRWTPKKIRSEFADNPSEFASTNRLDWLIYSPTFDSGVSIEGNYFDVQFEYVRPFEAASNASQRGERYRAAIRGDVERHVYISNRGLPSMPPVEVFTIDYWRELLSHPTDMDAVNLARQLGADTLCDRICADAPEDWLELPELLAITARETYFKRELLQREWRLNGWEIAPGPMADSGRLKQLSEQFYDITQGLIEQKARTLAKATPRRQASDEAQGAIEATKHRKWEIKKMLGDYPGLNDSTFMESWVVAAGGRSLPALQVRSLLLMAHQAPELWSSLSTQFGLHAIGKAESLDLPELPCSPNVYETARLLKDAPGLFQLATGQIQQWTNADAVITNLAAWARDNAKALARLTTHNQRIHGYQFTPKTTDIKCAHKLLAMVGLEPQCHGRQASGNRLWQYRLKASGDVDAKLSQVDLAAMKDGKQPRTHDLERQLHRLTTDGEVFDALNQVLADRIRQGVDAFAAVESKLLEKYTPSVNSVGIDPITETSDKPLYHYPKLGLRGTIESIWLSTCVFLAETGQRFTGISLCELTPAG